MLVREIEKDNFLLLKYFTGSIEKLKYGSSMDLFKESFLHFAECKSSLGRKRCESYLCLKRCT